LSGVIIKCKKKLGYETATDESLLETIKKL